MGIIIVIVIAVIFLIVWFKIDDNEFRKNLVLQIVGELIAGAIGFLSAFGMNYDEKQYEIKEGLQRQQDARKEALAQITNEISENKYSLILEQKVKQQPSILRRRLLTESWHKNKYLAQFVTPSLLEGLKALYDKIEYYNALSEFYKHLLLWRQKEIEKILTNDLKNGDHNLTQSLIDELYLFEKIIRKEAIKQGFSTKESWPFKDSSPEDDFKIPYFEIIKP